MFNLLGVRLSELIITEWSSLWQTNTVSLLTSVLILLIPIAANLSTNTLYLVLITEAVWIINYTLYLSYALIYDNILILSFILGFLIFSACEISLGLSVVIIHLQINHTLNLLKLVRV